MVIFKKSADIKQHLQNLRLKGIRTGYVPTMGALHEGHLSLISESKKQTQITICSIFVNPTQFNNPEDFSKYPVTIDQDIYKLEKNKCDVLFLPDVAEMYPRGIEENFHVELGYLENILEGRFRPGHFQGVCNIVKHLAEIIEPDIMFLGQKDYQQCMVIKKLLQLMNSAVSLQVCDTVREPDGLAMSSRNLRLNAEERKTAVEIYNAMDRIKKNVNKEDFVSLTQRVSDELSAKGFKVDYIQIADAETLLPVNKYDDAQGLVVLAAAYLNNIRLIDNLIIKGE
ncbi:pantoate--beta-alanine ligase [soil metagenome]